MDEAKGMTLIVKTVTRLVSGFILAFGIYTVLFGHLTPGGGFAGGAIIALAFVLLMLAYGKEEALKRVSEGASSILDSTGALIFLVVALLGFSAGYFFENFLGKGRHFALLSSGTIPVSNIAIGLKVGVSIFAAIVGLSIFRHMSSEGEDTDEEE